MVLRKVCLFLVLIVFGLAGMVKCENNEKPIFEFINNFINENIVWVDDCVLYGEKDHWATPDETYKNSAGDCEDIAITKYFAVREWIGTSNLFLMYCKDAETGCYHVVLFAKGYIFDNKIKKLLPLKDRPDLFPVFYFNEYGIYNVNFQRIGGVQRLPRWEAVLNKMKGE